MGTEKSIKNNLFNNSLILGLFVIISSIAVYINTLGGDFIWDDMEQIVDNPVIKDIRNIPSFFTSDLWRLIDNPTIGSYYYRPFFLLSLTVDYNLWGLNPLGYHITNLVLHALSSYLVYLIGRRLFQNNTPAFMGSMLFAVHPVHVESVAWISGRTDPMAAVFFLLSFYLYIIFRDGKGVIMLFLSLTAYSFSLLSKEMGITLPLLLIAYEFSFKPQSVIQDKVPNPPLTKRGWGDFRDSKIRILQIAGIYLVISAIYIYIRALVLGEAIGHFSAASPLEKRIYTSFGVILDYIRIMILPVNLKVLYDIPLKESFFGWKVIFSLLLLAAVCISTLLAYRKDKTVFFIAMWFFITILPVSNIVPLKPTMMAERLVYIPSIGICLFAGLVFYKAYQNFSSLSSYLKAFIITLLSILSLITFQRNKLWENEVTYFEKMADDAPKMALSHHGLGDAYLKTGNMDKAIKEWKMLIQVYPLHPETNNSLGNIALMQGDYHEAVRRYRIALKGDSTASLESHYNLALALERLGNTEEAIFHYREFIRTASPKYMDVVEQVADKLRVFDRKTKEMSK